MRKKLLALLLAAALALSLLAGCGGGESVASALLKLLGGRYPNISIEIDPELEADLRQAIRKAEAENAGDDDAVIRAALETALGSTITFRYLGDGQKGATAFDLVFYAGSDPDKAAQAAYSQWNPILSNVPADGKYDTSLAMVETNSGVWMLVKATVEKAGTVDKPEPEPVTLKSLSVTGPSKTFQAGDIFEKTGMVVTATYSDGTTKDIDLTQCTLKIDGQPAENYRFTEVKDYSLTVSFGGQTATVTITVHDNANGYYEDDGTYFVTGSNGLQELYDDLTEKGDTFSTAKITLNSSVTLGDAWPENITFTGELNGNGNKITMEGDRTQGLFNYIGDYSNPTGTVKDLTIQVNGTISGSGAVGGIAGTLWKGTVTGCSVTGGSISISGISGDVGGVVGFNSGGSVTACYSTGAVTGSGNTGGVVGHNYNGGTVNDCYSTGTVSCGYAGGVVGKNSLSSSVIGCYHAVGEVSGFIAGGVVGWNDSSTVTACYSTSAVNGTHADAGGVVGNNSDGGTVTACFSTNAVSSATGHAGGVVGYNENGSNVTACYWSGYDGDGIGYDETGKYSGGTEYFGKCENMVTGNWNAAMAAMNTALDGTNCPWRYELTGALPTLTQK